MSKGPKAGGRMVGLTILALAVVGVVLALAYAPYVYAELWPFVDRHAITTPGPAKIAKGRMADDYFAVQDLGGGVFAIGEPRYYQQNYIYLIVGRTRALLFDSSSGTRDIAPVVASLTKLPVTVMVSHLHFDHLGGIKPFDHVAMIDLPQTRADVSNGVFTPGRYEWMGHFDGLKPPSVRIAEWFKPGDTIDLGGRTLTVLSTPGHTPTSAALYDGAQRRLFIGDYVYPGPLYAFLPGASLSAYQTTARRLLATLPPDTVLWAAHCCRKDDGTQAPWLSMGDLRDVDAVLTRIKARQATATGLYPRTYPVNDQMTLEVGLPWNNR
jgi:glyoxylase-like metal-dependent hydrolase (beta-lactamase superfamily II)